MVIDAVDVAIAAAVDVVIVVAAAVADDACASSLDHINWWGLNNVRITVPTTVTSLNLGSHIDSLCLEILNFQF